MATADLDFNLRITGTPDDIAAVLKIMLQYDKGKDGVYFSFTTATIGEQAFRFPSEEEGNESLIAAARAADTPVEISANGPYGKFGELDEIDIFREMAEAAPGACFTGSISGFAGYADQSVTARLADGKLHVSTFYLSDDVRGEAESEYASTYLPHEKLLELFGLDGDEFDDDAYEEFVLDCIVDAEGVAEFFEETDYDEFLELIGVDCPLNDEEYAEAVRQITESGCPTCEEFFEENEYAERQHYIYDPIEKKYEGRSGPELKSGVAYSINDTIREYLVSVGLPCDDEAIDALSVEDVYAILAGTYGKETAQEGEIASDLPSEENLSDGADQPADDVVQEIPRTIDEENSAGKTKRSGIWLLILLFVICAAGVGVWFFFDYIEQAIRLIIG